MPKTAVKNNFYRPKINLFKPVFFFRLTNILFVYQIWTKIFSIFKLRNNLMRLRISTFSFFAIGALWALVLRYSCWKILGLNNQFARNRSSKTAILGQQIIELVFLYQRLHVQKMYKIFFWGTSHMIQKLQFIKRKATKIYLKKIMTVRVVKSEKVFFLVYMYSLDI